MSTEVNKVITDLGTAFEQFKAANDERIKQIESKGSADAVLVQNMETANAAITELQAKLTALETAANRPQMDRNGREIDPTAREHREVFNRFMRKGAEAGLRELEIKAALSTTTDADGGFAVPEELDRSILDLVKQISPMRRIANVISAGAGYKKLVNLHGTASGWVGETAARPATGTAQLAELVPFWGEIYANPQATQTTLDDVFFNVESWLGDEVSLEFGKQEGTAYISGDGVNKPKGFLAYPTATTADGVRAFGTLQYIASGVAGGLGSNPDKLIDLVHSVKAEIRQGAVFTMNSATTGKVRQLKDGNGAYYWQPSTQAGTPPTFLGYPVEEMEGMPALADLAFPIAFGNFKRGYKIADRTGVRVLRDPFTNKPYVGFYSTKRVGGMVEDSEAIKLYKTALS